MDVYLVPFGGQRYEPYCEIADGEDDLGDVDAGVDKGYVGRLVQRGRQMLSQIEKEWRERQASGAPPPEGRIARLKARAKAWMAERVAEQRLLWHLRRQVDAALIFPSDLTAERADAVLRESLKRDYERHRNWFAVNVVGFVVSGLLVLVPGPNVLAYYFLFRLAGHYLSMKGARQGLDYVSWDPRPSDPLRELREAASLPPPARAERVKQIASLLHLDHLPAFFNKVAIS